MRKTVSKAMRVGRTAVFLVGLAVILAAVFGVASEAVAAKKVPSLKRGVVNAVTSVTTLAGTLADPILRLDNNGEGPALDLQVEPDGAPLTANPEAGTATGLSADELDGEDSTDFVSADGIYTKSTSNLVDGQPNGYAEHSISCDVGDKPLGGGYSMWNVQAGGASNAVAGFLVSRDEVYRGERYLLGWWSDDVPVDASLTVTCVDLGEPRQR